MLGCSSSSEANYQFGVTDMERVVVGTWSGMWGRNQVDAGVDDAADDSGTSDAGTGAVPFTLVIEHPMPAGAHPLCDPRQFASVNGSSASFHPLCVSTSEMPIRATLNVSDGSFTGVELAGKLRVPGEQLNEADLSLRATTADVAIVAQWIVGKWLFCIASHTTGIPLASCTLDSRS